MGGAVRMTAKYPCCDRQMYLPDNGQRWTRRCRHCDTTWDVRIGVQFSPIDGMTVTTIEFTDTKSTEYRHKYGV